MSVQALNTEMQAKMTMRLTELRNRIMSKMTSAGERIMARPQLKGDDSLSKIQSHQVMQKNEDGAMIVGFSMGVPGLSGAAETMADVAIELYGDRRATHMRPQDDMEYSMKSEAQIREDNERDLALFMNLNYKLDIVTGALASGSLWALLDQNTGELNILDQDCTISAPKPEHAKTQKYGIAFGMDHIPAAHRMAANNAPGM